MKSSSFVYQRAYSKTEALSYLAEFPDETKILAGGQSLIPMMNMRLARPDRVVDISGCADLAIIRKDGDSIVCGPVVPHVVFERGDHPALADCAAMSRAARLIGYPPIRSVGTIGGSISHGDSTSEWCLLMLVLSAHFTLECKDETRSVAADAFFKGLFTTDTCEDELLTSITLPASTRGAALVEHSRRHGDFATIAAASYLHANERNRVVEPRIALGGVSDRPIRIHDAERILIDVDLNDEREIQQAVESAARLCATQIEVVDDAHASAEYRRRLTVALVSRALTKSVHERGLNGEF